MGSCFPTPPPSPSGPDLLKSLFYRTETINELSVWLGMARMEMDSNLKTSGRIFQVCALVSEIKSVKSVFGYFLPFKIHLILFPL